MPEENKVIENAPVQEDNKEQIVVENKKPTIENILEESKPSRTVPESVFIQQKNEAKKHKNENVKLSNEIAELRRQIDSGEISKREGNDSIDKLAEEYNVDKDFVGKLASAIKADTEAKFEEKLRPFKEKEKKETFDKVFKEHYNNALKEMPEFANIADEDVIKALALRPENKDKSLEDIFEKVYGKVVVREKKPVESYTPGGEKLNPAVDMKRAETDIDYLNKVLDDPSTKKIYNENRAREQKR